MLRNRNAVWQLPFSHTAAFVPENRGGNGKDGGKEGTRVKLEGADGIRILPPGELPQQWLEDAKGILGTIKSSSGAHIAARSASRGRELLPAAKSIGEWLSLVEHLVRDQGVGGSNPLSPTIYFQ